MAVAPLSDTELKEKTEKYYRLENCKQLTAPQVNFETWEKLQHKANQEDLRRSVTQKTLVKVGAILSKSTELLLQSRNNDPIITMNADAIGLLGITNI